MDKYKFRAKYFNRFRFGTLCEVHWYIPYHKCIVKQCTLEQACEDVMLWIQDGYLVYDEFHYRPDFVELTLENTTAVSDYQHINFNVRIL